MRILGIGESVELGDMYLRLTAQGHDVRVAVNDPEQRDVMEGMLSFVSDWQSTLPWVREAGADGVIIFETAHQGELQASLRRDGYQVIGGSPLGTRLEGDRAFGQDVAGRYMDVRLAPTFRFVGPTAFNEAIGFVRERGGRYVYKLNGSDYASTRHYVGVTDTGEDVVALLAAQRDRWTFDEAPDFILMTYLLGVEVGVGAYFDGERFLSPACLDWEHKRFFPGDIGELTGEMGTLVTYRGAERLFDATLAHIAPLLASDGYVGYINLNTIINDDGIWPLEFTCRFGYPGFAILDALHGSGGWTGIFEAMLRHRAPSFDTHSGYAVGVVLTVPPFPYRFGYAALSKGVTVAFRESVTPADRDAFHFGEVAERDGHLVTAGSLGYVMVVTGRGDTAAAAQRDAYAHVAQVVLPNVRYRNDIGDRFLRTDRDTLVRLGYLS